MFNKLIIHEIARVTPVDTEVTTLVLLWINKNNSNDVISKKRVILLLIIVKNPILTSCTLEIMTKKIKEYRKTHVVIIKEE